MAGAPDDNTDSTASGGGLSAGDWSAIIQAGAQLGSATIGAFADPEQQRQRSQLGGGGGGGAGMRMQNTVRPNIAALMEMYNRAGAPRDGVVKTPNMLMLLNGGQQ